MRFLLCLLTFTLACTDDRPAVVREFGGRAVAWDETVKAEWVDVMRCVGLDTVPDTTVRLFILAANAPPLLDPQGRATLGAYNPDPHWIVIRGDLDDARKVWRHEFIHARLRDRNNHHGPEFQMAAQCEFAP